MLSSAVAKALIVEIIGVVVVGVGLGLEVGTGADVGYILITAGSAAFAIGALVYAKIVHKE